MDLWVPESNTFLTLLQTPHYLASLALLLGILLATIRAHETHRWQWSIGAGVMALALFQFHPFYVPTIFGVLGAWMIVESFAAQKIQWRLVGHNMIVAVFGAPSIIYHLWLVHVDPIMAWKAAQNLLFTPAWWLVLVSYGFLTPLALVGSAFLLRHRTPHGRFVVTWLIVTVALICSPLTWQRRLTEGLHVALVLAAIPGLLMMLAWLRARLSKKITAHAWTPLTAALAFLPLFGASTTFNLIRDADLFTARFPTTIPRHSFYYPTSAITAMRWIHDHSTPMDATLALGLSGNFFPMYGVRPTVLGHGVETADFARKYRAAYALAEGRMTASESALFLANEHVRFVLVTDADRDLWTIDPTTIPTFHLVHREKGAEVYETEITN